MRIFSSSEPMDHHIFNPFKVRLAHQTLNYHAHFLQLTAAHCFFKELPNNFKKCLQAQHHTMTTAKINNLTQQQLTITQFSTKHSNNLPRRIERHSTIYKQLKTNQTYHTISFFKTPIKQVEAI